MGTDALFLSRDMHKLGAGACFIKSWSFRFGGSMLSWLNMNYCALIRLRTLAWETLVIVLLGCLINLVIITFIVSSSSFLASILRPRYLVCTGDVHC